MIFTGSGKTKIVKFDGCYHGHVDALLVNAGSGLATFGESTSAGIPESFVKETLVIPLNNRNAIEDVLEQHAHEIACIIIEPIPANNGLLLQDKDYLVFLREKCTEYGVLLIFDEVISGFRVGYEGAAGLYNIQPDIVTYGKIIGGGMPVGAYGASKEIMSNIAPEGAVYQAGTLSANPVAMSAGFAACELLVQDGFYKTMENKTKYFVRLLEAFCQINNYEVTFPTIGSIFWVAFTNKRIQISDQIDPKSMEKFKILHHELLQRGVYLGPSGYEVGFISSAHTIDDLEKAAIIISECLHIVFK